MGEAKRRMDAIQANKDRLERERKIHVRAQRAEGDLLKAQSRIAELEAEVERLKSQKWFTLHTDTMNDLVQMGMARDTAWNDAIEAAADKSKEGWNAGYDATPHIRSLRR